MSHYAIVSPDGSKVTFPGQTQEEIAKRIKKLAHKNGYTYRTRKTSKKGEICLVLRTDGKSA